MYLFACSNEFVSSMGTCDYIVRNSPVAVLKSNIIDITVRFLPEFNAGILFPFSHGRFDNILVFCSYVEKINTILCFIL